jgi:uncharacterized protein YeaO (DUF488 family)
MPVATKRWNDPAAPEDGFRLLVCRLRPRGVSKERETWDEWWPDLGPSRALLDAFHGKGRASGPLPWADYRVRYLEEMRGPRAVLRIRALAQRVAAGEPLTLLCASPCTDPSHCHRTVLAGLVTKAASRRA